MRTTLAKSPSRRRSRGLPTALLTLFASLAVTFGSTTPAHAGAVGSAIFGGFNIPSPWGYLWSPKGVMTHNLNADGRGRGRGVTLWNSGLYWATDYGTVCNWRVDFVMRDNNGRVTASSRGVTHSTCNAVGYEAAHWGGFVVPPGTACAYLFSSSVELGHQCHGLVESWW